MTSTTASSVVLVGATGLTGAASFRSIQSSSLFSSLTTLTRRPLDAPAGVVASSGPVYNNKVVDFDQPASWALSESFGSGASKVFVSCLGTTKAQAGSIDNQRKIDLDLNLTLAQAAKDAGADTYILVSSGSASATSYSPYLAMKGKLEDGVKAMAFRSVYILQPGLLMGARTESRTAEGLTQSLFRGLGRLGVPVARYSVDAEDVGKAIAKLAAERKEGIHYVSNTEIIALAKSA